jgi:hypothetical protein
MFRTPVSAKSSEKNCRSKAANTFRGSQITHSVRRKNRKPQTCASVSTSMAAKIIHTWSESLEASQAEPSGMWMLGRRSLTCICADGRPTDNRRHCRRNTIAASQPASVAGDRRFTRADREGLGARTLGVGSTASTTVPIRRGGSLLDQLPPHLMQSGNTCHIRTRPIGLR